MRLLWLPDRLRAAGLTVVEVDGWRTHGSDAWKPEGVIFHATADKARTAEGDRLDDAGAIGVIRTGRPGLDGPIATAYVNRDGVWYVIASGRCNTARVGWAGPLKGLGNSRIIGIEAENDNRGEPWPSEQLRSLRIGLRAVLAGIGQPVSRLAGHKEHQPSPGPPGETSTKTDPYGIDMAAFRDWVAAAGEDDEMDQELHDKVDALARMIDKGDRGPAGPDSNDTATEAGYGSLSNIALLRTAQKAAIDARRAREAVERIEARPPGHVVISDEQLEQVLRRVLGGVDGATPPGTPG